MLHTHASLAPMHTDDDVSMIKTARIGISPMDTPRPDIPSMGGLTMLLTVHIIVD